MILIWLFLNNNYFGMSDYPSIASKTKNDTVYRAGSIGI